MEKITLRVPISGEWVTPGMRTYFSAWCHTTNAAAVATSTAAMLVTRDRFYPETIHLELPIPLFSETYKEVDENPEPYMKMWWGNDYFMEGDKDVLIHFGHYELYHKTDAMRQRPDRAQLLQFFTKLPTLVLYL